MPNEYMWAQTSGNFPDVPNDPHYGGGNNGGYESKQQSAQAPRNYQPESHSSYSGGAQYSSPPSSSYGGQPTRSSSYTHQQSPDAGSYTHQQQPQHQPERQQYGGSRSSSYQNGSGSHGAPNGDQVEQSVNMQDLIRENFGGQGGPSSSTVQLSPALLEHLQRVSPQSRDSKLYFLEPQSGGQSASGMIYPSSDLALANQLAVKHHRHACMRNLGNGPDLNEKVLRGTEWSMLDDERLELVTSVSTGNGQKMTFSTTVQELSLFRRK